MVLTIFCSAHSTARDRRRIDRRVSRLDPDIDDRDPATLDAIEPGTQGPEQLIRPTGRAETFGALAVRQRSEIGLRVGDALADPAVGDGAVALPRHPVLVQLVVEEGIIVGNDYQH